MSLFASHSIPVSDLNLIDCDHQELAQRVEAVRSAIAGGERVGEALERLRDFALTHYGLEENMMMTSRYPHAREHMRMHQRLIGVLNRVVHRSRHAGTALTQEAMNAVEELHLMHLRTDDARLGQWLNERQA